MSYYSSQSKLTPAEVSAAADAFEAAGNPRTYSDEGKALSEKLGLDYYDNCAVSEELSLRGRRAAWQAFNCHPAVKAYALAHITERGAGLPENVSYVESLRRAAESTRDQYGKARAKFTAKGGCPLKLHAVGGVRFSYQQNSYSDDSVCLIPVIGEATDEQLKICQANLSDLFRRMDTHTGTSGSGCNYSVSIAKTEAGLVAVVGCRASIME